MKKKKILIVDDEVSFLRLVKANLEKTGSYEVITESSGRNAITSACEFTPDLILLDILMPDADGTELIEDLKNNPATKDIPVIFLTAIVKSEEVKTRKGVISGYPFIAKPVSTKELVGRIEDILKG